MTCAARPPLVASVDAASRRVPLITRNAARCHDYVSTPYLMQA
jgi:hypothetical protein